MNGEPTKVLDGQSDQKVSQPDQNELNSQSNLKYSECLTNGRSCQNSPKLDNPEDVELAEKVSEDSNTNLENPKAPNSTNESEVLHNKVSNQDDATDTLKENTDTTDTLKENTDPTDTLKENTDVLTAEDSPELLPDNSDKSLGNTESLDNNSTDSQEMINENNDSVHTGKETDTTNGIESDHNSDDEACQYVDDAEDPISSGEPKEVERNIIEKSDSQESETGTFKIVTINRYHSDDENPSDSSGSEDEPRADTVSITTDGEDSRDNGKLKTIDIITLENDQTDNQNGSKSPEIHEIRSDNSDNDDCVVTAVEKVPKTAKKSKSLKNTPTSELRRSSRAIKRKKYEDIEDVDDEESDLEEVVIEDPLQGKSSFASNRKSLVNIATKLKRKIVQKKDDVIVIIDSPVKNRTPATKASNTLHQNIYQKIAAHGTSMTPISSKNVETKSTATQATPEPVLPTLTDDMFVVEAPSFIVPYVYEKPATVPFKEFVEKLGKEIEEERAKEEQELLEKKKAEKAKREQERKEKQERGEEVQESEEEDSDEVKKKKAEKAERKERRRRKKEDDDVSWDGSSSEESDDETISDDETRSKENVINDIKDIVPPPPPKTDSYFDLCLGKFFMDIGSNLVQEYVQADLLHQQNRKLYREKKAGHSTKIRQVSIAQLTKNLELSRKTNASFTFEQKKCKFCSFKTESALALDHHLETPHMKNNVYSCNFCVFDTPSPHNMLFHLDNSHAKKGRLDRPSALHQCVNCPFEDHGKGKLARHVISCAKKFKPETNLAPPVEWEHPAKIPKLTRARAPVPYQAAQFARHPTDGAASSNVRVPFNALTSPRFRPRMLTTPVRPSGLLIRQAPQNQPSFTTIGKKQSNHSILISAAPRQAVPIHALNASNNAKGVVMCEICDGYIKDLEQLRNHMQWIHKVKIHPKMIYNRPPLNCQKCQFRFFTDQGLERHLLGSHGLVTSAIQDAANKGKDAGRCPVCGRAYQRKLLAHVSRDHNLILKPAHLSYKCTVCTATFGMYRQFENHVYSAHSVVAKKAVEKKAAPAKENANDAAVQQLKNSEDITITPQPVKIGAAKEK